jgi:hypothetical protein
MMVAACWRAAMLTTLTMPVVLRATNDHQFPEVLVESDQNAALIARALEDRVVSWILMPVSDVKNVVTGFSQRRRCAAPDTRVQQKLHAESMIMGSTRS